MLADLVIGLSVFEQFVRRQDPVRWVAGYQFDKFAGLRRPAGFDGRRNMSPG
jgi:hypothetical protein